MFPERSSILFKHKSIQIISITRDNLDFLIEFDLTVFFYGAMVLMEIKKETVDAEITLVMLIQRVRDAENRAENKPSNGPLRAQSKAKAEYSAT